LGKTPPDKGTPVARRGRKATGQARRLTAGLPKEGTLASRETSGLPRMEPAMFSGHPPDKT